MEWKERRVDRSKVGCGLLHRLAKPKPRRGAPLWKTGKVLLILARAKCTCGSGKALAELENVRQENPRFWLVELRE